MEKVAVLPWEERQKFQHKPLTDCEHIVTPRIFRSTTVDLLQNAKKDPRIEST